MELIFRHSKTPGDSKVWVAEPFMDEDALYSYMSSDAEGGVCGRWMFVRNFHALGLSS